MNGYFKSRRRKIGVLTLVTACIFETGWMRSLKTFEEASFPITSKTELFIFSGGGILEFGRCIADDPKSLTGKPHWIVAPHHHQEMSEGLKEIRWYWRISNFGVGLHSGSTQQIDELVVLPYWTIVIPLTLLSAWLILLKRRTEAPPEPTPDR